MPSFCGECGDEMTCDGYCPTCDACPRCGGIIDRYDGCPRHCRPEQRARFVDGGFDGLTDGGD